MCRSKIRARLNPREEKSDGHHIRELRVPVGEELEVRVVELLGCERLELHLHGPRAVHVERDAHGRDAQDHDVEPVPQRLEVLTAHRIDL